MTPDSLIKSINFDLKNIAYLRFDRQSSYSNIISPITRIYLITKGSGKLFLNNRELKLEPDYLYIIPSYVPCTYKFESGLEHYYIHLNINLQNGLSIYNLYNINYKRQAVEIDKVLLSQLVNINPRREIPHHDPRVYQKKPWINKKASFDSFEQCLETNGILSQLFSRFIGSELLSNTDRLLTHKIQPILLFIQNNLSENISVVKLAEMACTSKDHFTKLFKSITGIPPSEFIIRKRIEKAQFLLLSSDLPLNEIIEKTGFRSTSYFCRLFKKYSSFTPEEYRKKRAKHI
ncbi:helix-turn-helix domain-containing protein [Sunxiuqinia sp. sy24]|uniref:helix-turn-helix domain-containing protein n=1 Tax=Sunxiuqinia sp. sy24 TaxID=3461495 RepID=UPI0040461AA2